jgi:hypothetical protein
MFRILSSILNDSVQLLFPGIEHLLKGRLSSFIRVATAAVRLHGDQQRTLLCYKHGRVDIN